MQVKTLGAFQGVVADNELLEMLGGLQDGVQARADAVTVGSRVLVGCQQAFFL